MTQEEAPTAQVSQEEECSQRSMGTQDDPYGKHTVTAKLLPDLCLHSHLQGPAVRLFGDGTQGRLSG